MSFPYGRDVECRCGHQRMRHDDGPCDACDCHGFGLYQCAECGALFDVHRVEQPDVFSFILRCPMCRAELGAYRGDEPVDLSTWRLEVRS